GVSGLRTACPGREPYFSPSGRWIRRVPRRRNRQRCLREQCERLISPPGRPVLIVGGFSAFYSASLRLCGYRWPPRAKAGSALTAEGQRRRVKGREGRPHHDAHINRESSPGRTLSSSPVPGTHGDG